MIRVLSFILILVAIAPAYALAEPQPNNHIVVAQLRDVARAKLVRKIQDRLKKLDCYHGPADGKWNKETQDAVKLALGDKTSTAKPSFRMLARLSGVKKSHCATQRARKSRMLGDGRRAYKTRDRDQDQVQKRSDKKAAQQTRQYKKSRPPVARKKRLEEGSSGRTRSTRRVTRKRSVSKKVSRNRDTGSRDLEERVGELPTSRSRRSEEPSSRDFEERSAELPLPSSAQGACHEQNLCTPVRVYYGTNRVRDDRRTSGGVLRVAYGWDRGFDLELGRAIVTVPKAQREVGEISRPGWWDRIWGTPPEGDISKHFVILADGFKVFGSQEAFLSEVREAMADARAFKGHAFIFVHGYNTTFDDALYRTAQIAYDLGDARDGGHHPFGTAFLYSWPSAGDPKDYPYDMESAWLSAANLRAFIELVANETGAEHVHLIAHSMGNVPLLNAMQELARDGAPPANINQIVLAAPDIDADVFARIASRVKDTAKGITLYASANDYAMDISRNVHKGKPRAGDVPSEGPVIVDGIDTVDVSSLKTDYFSTGHNTYVEELELREDLSKIVQAGLRPPDVRSEQNRPRDNPGGLFWRFERREPEQ